jgi:tetratricopeptide (TPR) repeat protein
MKKENILAMALIWLAMSGLLYGCSSKMQAKWAQMRDNPAAAIPHLQGYLDSHPESLDARRQLGRAYLQVGRNPEAAGEFETILKTDPQDPCARLNLGLAYLQAGDLDRTIAAWEHYRDDRQPLVEAEVRQQVNRLKAFQTTTHLQTVAQVRTEVQTGVQKALGQQAQADRSRKRNNVLAGGDGQGAGGSGQSGGGGGG